MALTVQEIYQFLYKNFNFQRLKTHFKMRTKEMKQGVKEVKKKNLSEIITSLLNQITVSLRSLQSMDAFMKVNTKKKTQQKPR